MIKTLRPSLRALLVHVIALGGILAYRYWLTDTNHPPSLLTLSLAEGIIATLLGIFSGLRSWWIAINLLFFPLLVSALNFAIHPLWYLLIFAVIWLVNWNAFSEQVPLYLSGKKTVDGLAKQLDSNQPFSFADFGCGLGSVLAPLARRFPQAQFVGYETAPLPYLVAKLRSLSIKNLKIKRESFWATKWNRYDVIYCFLSPAPMPEIAAQAKNRVKPGAVLISNTFSLPEQSTKVIEIGDMRGTRLLFYHY